MDGKSYKFILNARYAYIRYGLISYQYTKLNYRDYRIGTNVCILRPPMK